MMLSRTEATDNCDFDPTGSRLSWFFGVTPGVSLEARRKELPLRSFMKILPPRLKAANINVGHMQLSLGATESTKGILLIAP